MTAVAIPAKVLDAPAPAVKLYAVIAAFHQEHKAPTRRQLADRMGLVKTSAVDRHIKELERAGAINVSRPGGRDRNYYELAVTA